MRVKQITVKGLFGSFDHTVALNMEERITILHGLNGVGKTTLLSMIDSFFNKKFDELLCIDFNELLIEFESNTIVSVKIKTKERDLSNLGMYVTRLGAFSFSGIDSEPYVHALSIPKFARKSHLKGVHNPSDLDEIIDDLNSDKMRIELLNIINNDASRKEPYTGLNMSTNTPKWLNEVTASVDVNFVQCQRLILDRSSIEIEDSSSANENEYQNAIDFYSRSLAKQIGGKLTEYGGLSDRLDRSFPVRILKRDTSQELSEEDLRNRIQSLEKRRENLVANGLLKSAEETPFQLQLDKSMDDGTKRVLSVYIEDVGRKLDIFSEINKNIDLFKDIINQKLLRKKMLVDSNRGFIFRTDTGHELASTDLSSGEQNMIIMLYELLFNLKPGSLVLIDEPEISLHVAWKVEFLEDLVRIVELAEIDVLLATHSASLVSDRWDLTVGLKG